MAAADASNSTGFPREYLKCNVDEWGVTWKLAISLSSIPRHRGKTYNSEGQLFGTERLRKLIEQHHEISATEWPTASSTKSTVSQNAPLSDDRTLRGHEGEMSAPGKARRGLPTSTQQPTLRNFPGKGPGKSARQVFL